MVECARKHIDIRDREVHSFCASWRDDMSGAPGEEQPAELHGFDNETAERCNALLNNRAVANNEARFGGTARIQFLPNSGIRPLVYVFIRSTLQVEAAEDQRAHG